METTLNLILEKLTSMDGEIKKINTRLDNMEIDIKDLKQGQHEIESKLDVASDKLDDFESKNAQRHIEIIDKLNADIEFIKHKEFKNEEDIFNLKKNLQIIK
ncbi:MAG: hypothetical protein N4A48_13430 [Tepidibacter sp.]|jgi:predicted  nucleic acid-binding Zn-ribbon protein|uniref:hypothetical protein n=1 Tax=Tepidibacter sp. TaxID=2529387 RepID=UPI0025CF8E7D|nr:hypothetical protein [Tepidibacter sp.]MCT4509731.1 hypothetical protein [Tepidibacter sp.]